MPHDAILCHRGQLLGFSLIELVIVVVIIGIVGAVAVPRLSRGSEGAGISALAGNMAALNKAVEHYAAEHGGNFPDASDIHDQLTGNTNSTGAAWSGAPGELAYGPYLRKVPPLPVGDKKGNSLIALADGAGVGWLYKPATGVIRPNLNRDDGTTDEDLVTTVINSTKLTRDDLVSP